MDASVADLCARALAERHRDPAAALDLARRAVDVAGEGAPDARRALAALGACLAAFPADAVLARDTLERALRECEAAGDDELRCQVLNELGDCLSSTFQFDAAEAHLREAVELSRRLGRRGEEARALRLLGTVGTSTGDYAQALARLLEALAIHEADPAGEEDPWERGALFARIAIVYSNLDQFARSISYYRVALECFSGRYPLRAARTLYSMGITAQEMKDEALAEDCFRRSFALYDQHGDASGRALAQLGTAMTLRLRGEHAQAEALTRGVLQALEGDPVHRAHYADALWTLADVHAHRGEHAEALAHLERALPLFLELSRPAAHLAWLHSRFSRSLRELGRFQEALEHHERYHQLMVAHLEEQADARTSRLMVRFDTERALKDGEISRLRNVELEREIAERKEAEAALARAKAELEEANRELHALTIRDALTGLYNRRHLDQRLTESFALARRAVQPLSVAIFDVDDFKRINDTLSHATGDEVLRTVGSLLREHVRVSDVAARYGGEEFVVLFNGATPGQAAAAAEKLRAVVAAFPWSTLHRGLAVTVSAGVASAAGHADHEALLRQADARLYEAKAAGKNRVVA